MCAATSRARTVFRVKFAKRMDTCFLNGYAVFNIGVPTNNHLYLFILNIYIKFNKNKWALCDLVTELQL